ncbi:pyruvate, phosphate dikinase [Sphaerobacter thermophilus]|uniref:Pyruvate, phosphate dikinase n=1 Tax=Sphaerobacter thermophilus (strain ATCC 49802 / DSM 20745 / KCCM 41009 / NCIMB 13125 / S 6022) TaxID=479434 RepID=D1C1U0_SPHTD|nr:pyruvate, phosphate dikinase [Sphaerobacter thermophilus]ACZ38207.1 pyruvate, phosphate dikinase [Sphaerobacter thermophilus DSM 20745]
MAAHRWVYLFRDGNAQQRDLLGGKGANLAEMTNVGLPVPPGFTVTTEACNAYFEDGASLPEGLWEQVLDGLADIERQMGRTFGSPDRPLLVSVRSGAKFSMPGMMDTILNLGLNDVTVRGLAAEADERFAYDCYRRLIQMFAKVVLDVNADLFEDVIDEHKRALGVRNDFELPAHDLRRMVAEFQEIVRRETGQDFPDDPHDQLRAAIIAVFESWNNRRAIDYRNANNIPHNLGTAVNVQAMVYGNMGPDCATGVAFTRNPSTGEKRLFGEYLTNAQGEDVVAGVRTPQPIEQMADDPHVGPAYQQLQEIAQRLEQHYRDMQDLEFTIQNGKLYMLQTRTGKRTGAAAVKIAVDMVKEGLISKEEAVQRVLPSQLDQLLHPTIDPGHTGEVLANGLPASPGAATGQVVFDADEAKALAEDGHDVILVRLETSPEDFHGMLAARAVLTARGGMTSHAAVVARGMGKPAVVGCTALQVDYDRQQITINGTVIPKGDYITLDGSTGAVMLGKVPTIEPQVHGDLATLLGWADEIRKLGVRANADTPEDAAKARELGAQGIGLCRTEHMFFQGDRIWAVREMIIATTEEERRAALAKLEPMQREDFAGIFRAMDGFPVTIRTLDPPLHEFLPHTDAEIEELARTMSIDPEIVKSKVVALREANPMLGHRGCRLGITAPEITEMQARAIFGAALDVAAEGVDVRPEIMIPLVGDVEELRLQREVVDRVAREMFAEAGRSIPYLVGTMIELPRAALLADKIAEQAEFFSFGTNDLTQTTLGLSRDDSGRFLPYYVEHGIFKHDPFQVLDREGVGELIRIAVERGRKTRPDIKLGICGEHGGDPSSVEFCHQAGLDYVSASPFRVPIARLAAAQAALEQSERDV